MILIDILVTVMPVYAYYTQLVLIRKQQSLGSFSIYVCAIILIANILRIFFWLTTGYAINLLFQSIFVIIIQLILLKECVELSDHSIKQTVYWQMFWNWQNYHQYIKFLLGITAALTVVTLIFQVVTFGYFGQLIGFISLMLEASLGFPQLYSNWKNKSVKGLSLTMIGLWFVGDFFKTIYYIVEDQPFQFILCGVIQLAIDLVLIGQIILYLNTDYESVKNITPV